jgi:hypothetical protein
MQAQGKTQPDDGQASKGKSLVKKLPQLSIDHLYGYFSSLTEFAAANSGEELYT